MTEIETLKMIVVEQLLRIRQLELNQHLSGMLEGLDDPNWKDENFRLKQDNKELREMVAALQALKDGNLIRISELMRENKIIKEENAKLYQSLRSIQSERDALSK